jgi:O-antigen ligase
MFLHLETSFMNSKKFAYQSILVLLISFAVFLFGALALSVSSGYTYGPVLLLLPALGYVWVRPYPMIGPCDRFIIAALLIYFLVGVVTNVFHHLPSREYDNFSRFLLAVPVLLLLLRFPIKPAYFWSGVALGAVGAAVVAYMDFYVHGESRAGGHNNPIQFGDIAMLFACLLLAGFSWARQHSNLMVAVFFLGIMSGIFASLLSGARGGWLALPVAIGCFYIANGFYKNKIQMLVCAFVLSGLAVGFYSSQESSFLQMRIQDALSDLHQYTQAHNANTSLGIRFTLWQSGLDLVAQRPLLGWGSVENYLAITGDSSDVFQHFSHFHNEFLDAWVKRGLLGALALLALYLLPALAFYRQLKQSSIHIKPYAWAGLMLVLATLLFGLTQSFFCHASGVMVYVFMLVILWAQARSPAMGE